jgi:nucleoside-diphosphate-sugar epimerase
LRVLVTGATGFVGSAVVERLAADARVTVRAASRGAAVRQAGAEQVTVGNLEPDADWSAAVAGIDVVVHAAARVHIMRDSAVDPLHEFRRVNVAGTLALARQAAAAGATRFVFISSIKVNGEATRRGEPYRADDPPNPADPYGLSKHEAEEGLRAVAARTGMQLTIIRPVLVYGPGVKGNFRAMVGWVRIGVPLPLGGIDNRRSFVALDNLVDLIATCVRHPAAANRTFLVSDDDDVSTPELLRRVATAMHRSARLVGVPPAILRAVGAVTGRRAEMQRLCGDLQVDIGPTRELLAWRPVVRMSDALRGAVADVR